MKTRVKWLAQNLKVILGCFIELTAACLKKVKSLSKKSAFFSSKILVRIFGCIIFALALVG
jgi:hypothetical protein